jgi:Xaa-Pro aminopeptidase
MFAERRRRFMDAMEEGVALFFAAPEKVRSNDTQYRFRQDSDFFYLTGFPEPGAVALLLPAHPEHKFVLFVRPRDPERETWDGRRAGPEGARVRYGADASYTIDRLAEELPKYLENTASLYLSLGKYPEADREVQAAVDKVKAKVRQGIKAPRVFRDPGVIVNEMRLKKTAPELEIMRRAAAISSEAHRAAMQALRPGMHEYEIEALIEFVFRRHGAAGPSYNTIVGSGVNATILHYIENSSACADGDLLLVDAGAEVLGYSADITRTYPVNGRFSPAQREVYEIVLGAQKRAIAEARVGRTFDAVHNVALRTLVEGLVKLGLLRGEVDQLIADEAYKPYYMHRTSHWLGLDVHDVGDYRDGESWRRLEPGMVLTVEPGLYFGEDRTEVPAPYRGMGIRIEDDVLVTQGDPEVLTAATPKTVAEIESIMTRTPSPLEPATSTRA